MLFVFLSFVVAFAKLDQTTLDLGYQVIFSTPKETYDTQFAQVVITPEISQNQTSSLYCWSTVSWYADATQPTFYIAYERYPVWNSTDNATNHSDYFFGNSGYGGQSQTLNNIQAGTYYIGHYASCPYESCISSIVVKLSCYAVNASGYVIPPEILNQRDTAVYTVSKNTFLLWQINVTDDMLDPSQQNKFLLYIKLSITDFWPGAELVMYIRKNTWPGIQPTQFNYKYPIAAPQQGSYVASPFYLTTGTWYLGVYGAEMALFETTSSFYFKAGYNAAVLNSASQISIHYSFLLSSIVFFFFYLM